MTFFVSFARVPQMEKEILIDKFGTDEWIEAVKNYTDNQQKALKACLQKERLKELLQHTGPWTI